MTDVGIHRGRRAGRRQHDASAASLEQMRHRVLTGQPGALEIDGDRLVEGGLVDGPCRPTDRPDAGVGDHVVDPPEFPYRRPSEAVEFLGAGDVSPHGEDPTSRRTDLARGFLEIVLGRHRVRHTRVLRAGVADGDVGASASEREGMRSSLSPRTAGDQGDTARHVTRHLDGHDQSPDSGEYRRHVHEDLVLRYQAVVGQIEDVRAGQYDLAAVVPDIGDPQVGDHGVVDPPGPDDLMTDARDTPLELTDRLTHALPADD